MPETKKDVLFSLRELTRELVKKWKSLAKNESTREKVVAFRDGVLNPVLDKICIVAANAIQLRKNSDFKELLRLIRDIYKSAGDVKEFRIPKGEGEEHLSWSLASKLALERIYILGALSVFEDNVDALSKILNLKVKYPERYQYVAGRTTLLIVHPFFNFRSGEGDLRAFFDDARNRVQNNKVFAEWFDNEEEKFLSSFIRFDFLRGLYLFTAEEKYRWYNNFKRFYSFRIIPTIRILLTDNNYAKMFRGEIKSEIIKFLDYIDKERDFRVDGLSWITGNLQALPELKENKN